MAVKQAIKKGTGIHKFSVSSFKEKMGLTTTGNDLTMSSADKPMSFIEMPEAFRDALKINGYPQGYLSIITGWSNTGKSTLVNCLISSCLRQGIVPVIYDTENNFDFKYAIDCGMKAEPVYGEVEVEHVDEETGEVTTIKEKRIIEWSGDFFYFNSRKIAEVYGGHDHATNKETSKKRTTAVIEDIAYSINSFLDAQESGELPVPLCFIWDSIGSCINKPCALAA